MFNKKQRLAKSKDVKKTLNQGRTFFNQFFSVKYLPTNLPSPRFTVIVSTKTAKKATARNRLKRIVREFIRLRAEKFNSGDYAVIIKPLAAKKPEGEVLNQLSVLLERNCFK